MVSRVDQFYRSLLLSKFFTKGWGKPDNLKRIFEFRKILSNRESCQALVEQDYPISIDKDYKDGDCRILEGHFKSPFVDHMPGIMPKEVETASFQAVLPLEWQHPKIKPICIHLAGTGDHFFWRRRLFTARPLLKEAGIASILLENPFYGSRKPKSQVRSSLHNVSDLFVMGGALILESIALLRWCERQGWGPLGLSGVSMGGHMASLAATNWQNPISLVPCLSWSTASCVFTQGVMSGAIPWHVLQEQFFKNNLYHDEISKMIVSPEKAYLLGQQFVINFAQDLEDSQTAGDSHISQISQAELTPQATTASVDASNPNEKTNTASKSPNPSPSTTSSPSLSTSSSSSSSTSSSSSSSPLKKAAQSLEAAAASVVSANLNLSLQDNIDPLRATTGSKPHEAQKPKQSTRDEGRRLTLNYAQTKQSQQQASKNHDHAKIKPRLSLGHAVAKSKLLFSRNSLSVEEGEQRSSSSNNQQLESLKKKNNLQEESYEFMRGVMDECTHLGNFSVPVDPKLVIIVAALQDAYIPREGVLPLDKLWPGSEVRYVDQGHIGAVLLYQNVFRQAVIDAFDRQVEKYYPEHCQSLAKTGKQGKKGKSSRKHRQLF